MRWMNWYTIVVNAATLASASNRNEDTPDTEHFNRVGRRDVKGASAIAEYELQRVLQEDRQPE